VVQISGSPSSLCNPFRRLSVRHRHTVHIAAHIFSTIIYIDMQ
jgi:hypothetical protein